MTITVAAIVTPIALLIICILQHLELRSYRRYMMCHRDSQSYHTTEAEHFKPKQAMTEQEKKEREKRRKYNSAIMSGTATEEDIESLGIKEMLIQ